MKPARQRDPRRPRRHVARAAPHDVGEIFRRKGRREEEIPHRRQVVVDAEEDVRLALAQHLQRMFVVLGAHEAKAQSERLAERLQKARIDALGHALFQTVAEERLMSADVDDAQVGRRRQVGVFRRIEAHELVLRPIEKGLAQIRLEAWIDPFRIKDRIAEVLQQTFPLLRRDELRGHERHAQEQLLSVLSTARAVQDGVDLAPRKRPVQRLGGLMLDDVDAHALLAHERRQRIGIQAVLEHADPHVGEHGGVVRLKGGILAHIEGEDRIRRAIHAEGERSFVTGHLARREVHVDAPLAQHLARRPLVHLQIFVLPARAARHLVEVALRKVEQQPLGRSVGKGRDIKTADAQHGRRIHRMEQTLRRKQHEQDEKKDDAAAHDGIHFQHLSCSSRTNRPMYSLTLTIV